MKKALIAINVLLLCIIFLIGYLWKSENKNDIKDDVPDGKCNICYTDTTKLEGLISSRMAMGLSYAYYMDPAKSRIFNTKQEDALSLVFDLKKVKKFISLIEQSTCDAGCNEELGIRFYYIKYDTSAIREEPEEEKQKLVPALNKHSLAMVPVYKEHGEWYDFGFENVSRGKSGCNFQPKSILNNKARVLISINADNHGGVGPPPKYGYYPSLPEPYERPSEPGPVQP